MSTPPSVGGGLSGLSAFEKVVALVTAFVVLLTAYLAYKTTSLSTKSSQVQSTATSQSADLATLQTELKDVQAQNKSLNAALASALAVPQPSDSQSAATAATPAVRRQGSLTVLPNSLTADLDAPSTDPQWGRQTQSGSGEIDALSSDGTIKFGYSIESAKLGSLPPTYLNCSNNQSLQKDQTYDVSKGLKLCVITDEGRYATVTVSSVSASSMVLAIVVWEKS